MHKLDVVNLIISRNRNRKTVCQQLPARDQPLTPFFCLSGYKIKLNILFLLNIYICLQPRWDSNSP